MERIVRKSIVAVFCVIMVSILMLVLLCFEDTSFLCKQDFSMSQSIMFLIGVMTLLILGIGFSGVKFRRGISTKSKAKYFALSWMILLIIQAVFCYYAYFITDWDVRVITESAYCFAGGDSVFYAEYLGQYPNNIVLVMIFAVIFQIVRFFAGNIALQDCIYVVIILQCVLNTLSGICCHCIVAKETKSRRAAWYASLIYMIYIGISPWLMIPYSDSMALIFPIGILMVYMCFGEKKYIWIVIGFLSAIGYLIKPQTAIVLIAIMLVEMIRGLKNKKAWTCLKRICSVVIVLSLITGPAMNMLIEKLSRIEPERNVGMMHFVMMGLNEKTNGVYSYDDVVLSTTPKTADERRIVQIEEIKNRISKMKYTGLLEHVKKKTLTNYADGTFAWGCEGEFFIAWPDRQNARISHVLRSYIDSKQGENYVVFLTASHCLWLALIMGSILYGIGALRIQKDSDIVLVAVLSIIGITLFELIFEARARYLYIYAPFFVMLGTMGYWSVIQRFKKT